MKLIDILVRELPKRGGWPERAEYVVQDCDDTEFYFFTGGPVRFDGKSWWFADVAERDDDSAWIYFEGSNEISDDHDTSIISREQYESALADSKPEWDGEGLPNIGCEIEVNSPRHGWKVAVVTAVTDSWIVAKYSDGVEFAGCHRSFEGNRGWKDNHSIFRPIRSEADKKKEAVEKAIADALLKDGDFDHEEALRLSTFVYGAISRNEIPHIRID